MTVGTSPGNRGIFFEIGPGNMFGACEQRLALDFIGVQIAGNR